MADEPYAAPCRDDHGSQRIEHYQMPWSGIWFSPTEQTTVWASHDPRGHGSNAIVLRPGDLVEGMARAGDASGYWWDYLWVRSGPHEGTCVYTDRSWDRNIALPIGFDRITA